jgi:formate dehydrogenase iron-sulfur subunit
MIMEGDPFVLIEGMVIAGLATGATKGYVYLRSEYPTRSGDEPRRRDRPRKQHSGRFSVLGSGRAFDMEIRVGAGAYVCGEETSLLELAGRQARRGARQAAAAGAQGVPRPSDRGQQRDLARFRAGDHRQGR